MTTMNDLYQDGSDHEACPKCGYCLECDGCICHLEQEYPGYVEKFGFPFKEKTMKFGWIPDLPRFEDYRYKGPITVDLPPVVDNITAPVQDQGELGSCVYRAIVTLLESAQVQAGMDVPYHLSPLFGYHEYCARYNGMRDEGASFRQALSLVADLGLPREGLWPYNEIKFPFKPPREAYKDAETRFKKDGQRIFEFIRLRTEEEKLSCLAEGYGFVCGISVYENFIEPPDDGVIPMPEGQFLGGHAIYVYGYNKNWKSYLCQNSWGVSWGMEGRFCLPFEYLYDLSGDFWTVRFK